MQTVTVRLIMVNTFFDFDDYDNPIQTYIDERIENGLSGFARFVDIYVQHNHAVLKDEYLPFFSEEKKQSFISIETNNDRLTGASENNFVIFTFKRSSMSVTYERSVYTLFDVLSTLGGISKVFTIIGYIIVAIFSSRSFNYSVLSKLYQVDTIG